MNNLVSANRWAITAIAFMTSPIGLLIVIAIAASVETAGIALFFSSLFIEKAREYMTLAGFAGGLQNPALLSLGIGAILSLVIMLGVLVLKLIGKGTLSKTISVAFALLAIVTYWQVLGTGVAFSMMKLLGVCLMVAVPSLIVAVVSSHLADLILQSDTFRTMQAQIFAKAAGARASTFAAKSYESHLN
jgi:hypothetical protein